MHGFVEGLIYLLLVVSLIEIEKKKPQLTIENNKVNLKSNPIFFNSISISQLRERIEKLNKISQIKILKYNTIVHAAVENYLRMGNSLGKILALSEFYFPLFEEILTKHGIPHEF